MEAYNAVHNQESREELYAKRDELSEMDLSLISDVELDEIAEVALQELFEKGFTVNQADAIFDNLITEAKVTYGHDTESARQAKVQRLKGALKGAIGKARMKSARGAVSAYGAYRSAKQTADDIRRRTTQTAKNVSAQTAKKASEAKAGVKTGLKGMIKKAAEKVASKASGVAKRMDEAKKGDGNLANNYPPYDKVTRGDVIAGATGKDQMGGKRKVKEETQQVDELYKGKHGQSEKEYADSRSPGGKMVSGTSKMSGAEYTHGRRVKAANPGMQPDVGGKTKPKSQGKMDRGTRADLEYRKANLKKEELEATGLFTAEEIERILDIMCEDQFDEADSIDAMRERAAKRRQQRYGKQGGGGRDDFRPYTKADYERGEANDPRKKK